MLGSPAAAGTLSLTDLGTLGGSTSTGAALNDNGYATGYSTTSGGATHAFLYNPTSQTMTDLGVVAGQTSSMGYGINDSNVVVGASGADAFSDTSGVMTSLGAGVAYAVDNDGVSLGSIPVGSTNRTAEWSAAGTRTLFFGGSNSQGLTLNGSGQFSGTINGNSGYYADGTSTQGVTNTLGSFTPVRINDSDVIAGADAVLNEAAMYNEAGRTETPLGKLAPTDASSVLNAINTSGLGVGTSGSAGFEWTSSGGMVSLTSLLSSQYSGWTIVAAYDVNDNGRILAEGSFNGGPDQAVILGFPTPEPSSLALAAAAAAAGALWAGAKRLRRRA